VEPSSHGNVGIIWVPLCGGLLGVARPVIDGIPGHALVITTCLCIYMKDRLKVKCLMTTQVVIRTFPDSALDGCPAVGHRTSVKFARSIAEVGERKKRWWMLVIPSGSV